MSTRLTFVEALHDLDKYFDQQMIDYIEGNLKDPSKKGQFLQAMKRYRRLAERESDPLQALYFEYRMFLPETQARILAREFYQKEIRSGTGADTAVSSEGEEFHLADSLGYGNQHSNLGIFANLTQKDLHPEVIAEFEDLMNKLFSSKYLTQKDKIVLVTRLIFATGPNLRYSKTSNRTGLDLETVMDNPPPEWDIVMSQIDKLVKFGLAAEDITPGDVLQGAVKKAENGVTVVASVPPLVDKKTVNQVSEPAIKKALKELIGKEDIKDIYTYMLEAKSDKSDAIKAIMDYISGQQVKMSELIKAIVYTVDINIKKKTRLSKSKMFTGNLKKIATAYKELAKLGGEENIIKVQDLFMAPVLDNYVKENQ